MPTELTKACLKRRQVNTACQARFQQALASFFFSQDKLFISKQRL